MNGYDAFGNKVYDQGTNGSSAVTIATGTVNCPSQWTTYPYTQPSYTLTTTYPQTEEFDEDVHIEKADNGFIVSQNNTTLVAKTMVELTEILTQLFEEKKSE